VFDIDGTVCFDGRHIAPHIVAAVRRCQRSHPIVFASARPIRDLVPVLPDGLTDVHLVGGNGAFTRVGDRIQVSGFTADVRRLLDDLIDRHALEYLIDSSWDYSYHVTGDRDILTRVDQGRLASRIDRKALTEYVKVVLFAPTEAVLTELAALGLTMHQHHAEDLIDLSPTGVDKAMALSALSVGGGRYVAFGNDHNDIRLFENARYAVCVGDSNAGRYADLVIARDEVSATIDALASVAAV
jgi:HAD superfamily hydrolase (TIGR01484 family)